jgi:hypothetical protein
MGYNALHSTMERNMGTSSTGNKGKDPRAADRISQRMGGIGNANDRPATGSNKSSSTGTGGLSSAASQAFGDPRAYDRAMRAMNGAGPAPASPQGKQTEGGQPSGGSAVTKNYEPGAVPNKPHSNPLTEIGKAALIGPLGMAAAVVKGALVGKAPDPFDDSEQEGWARDRSRGWGSYSPNDPRGNSAEEEREIAGRPLRAEREDSADDQTGATSGDPVGTDIYSDVMLKDRRKPSLKQMLETML